MRPFGFPGKTAFAAPSPRLTKDERATASRDPIAQKGSLSTPVETVPASVASPAAHPQSAALTLFSLLRDRRRA